MKHLRSPRLLSVLFSFILMIPTVRNACSREFIHPGLDMTLSDLGYMRKQVNEGAAPWADAFKRLLGEVNTEAAISTFAHVQRGAYGKPNIGGGELRSDSELAYNCALLWYITGEKKYAEKAKEILVSWSGTLQDFDYNDAKLLAGWTGHLLCNAAEILRYTYSGWDDTDTGVFTEMMMTVYYPLLRYYYPQANGNWDGAIIHSILAIAVFTDNRPMFENAIEHFLHGPVNGSLFRYIYPSGQCQESTRDQGHVQLGLGEFAGAARVAFTQGVDLFTIGGCRLAAGYEYTAGFLLGNKPHCYGNISERAMTIRDDYEYVYRHYSSIGLELPHTKACADIIRGKASRSILTAFRAPATGKLKSSPVPETSKIGFPAGAGSKPAPDPPSGSVRVEPGVSIQEALDKTAGSGRWVIAAAGVHLLRATLKIPSGSTLAGEGSGTILFLDPASGMRETIVKGSSNLQNITIRDLVIEGNTRTDPGSDPNSTRSFRSSAIRGGIMLVAEKNEKLSDINLINITVRNCTWNAVFINGASGVNITSCDLNESGSSVVPGPKLQHNLLITGCTKVRVTGCRLANSPHGSGLAAEKCSDADISDCEISRNAYYGLLITESKGILISGNLVEANDRSGILIEFRYNGSEDISIKDNLIRYNNGYGTESWYSRRVTASGNKYEGNGTALEQELVSERKMIIMN